MKQIFAPILILLCVAPVAFAAGGGVNMDGTINSMSVSLEVANEYDVSVGVMWIDPKGGEIKVMHVGAGASARMDTTVGHRFVVRQVPSNQIVKEFTVRGGEDRMTVAPAGARKKAPLSVLDLADEGLEQRDAQSTEPLSQSSAAATPKIHPLVTLMNGRRSTSVGAKFKSLSSRPLDIYWEDGADGVPQGTLMPGRETTTNTYEGHQFYFTQAKKKSNEIARVYITENQSTYVIRDIPKYTITGDVIKLANAEEAFQKEYLEKNGIQYRHYYGPDGPRAPPTLHMWPADHIGQVHHVESPNGFWTCKGSKDECQSKDKLDFNIEVVSTHPKVYIIENFFSDFEADEIIAYAKPRAAKSTVGQGDSGGVRTSETRTSSNTWMSRTSSEVSNTLYLRAADVLKVDEKLLTADKNAEDMQVVHYAVGEKYDAHHDWGVSGYPESRYITLLLYCNDMSDKYSGGETAFPKGNGGTGFKVAPKKGTAVLFYSLLEDGNGDDLSLHQAVPVVKGEKWLANFWVWDPKKRNR